jgi:hypothetical protein
MLQQLTAVMTALAADLQDEAAVLAAAAWDQKETLNNHGVLQEAMHVHKLLMCLWGPKALDVDAVAWLCHPSGHAEAGLQLATAALQHSSALAQHLLPDFQQQMPQEAAEVLDSLQTTTRVARALCMRIIVSTLPVLASWQQQGQGSEGVGLQQLLLSPQRLPCIAAVLTLLAGDVSTAVAAHSGQVGSSGCGSSSTGTKLQQYAPGSNSGSGSASSGYVSSVPSSCQLQLLQLLGLAPELTTWSEEPLQLPALCTDLSIALGACKAWCDAVLHPSGNSGMGPWQLQQQLRGFQAKQQGQQLLLLPRVLLLLPTVLLPCASSLLSASTQDLLQQQQQRQQQRRATLEQLLDLCSELVVVGNELNAQQQSRGLLPQMPHVDWVQEVLGVVLQLVDQLISHQQAPTPVDLVGGRPGSSASAQTNSSSRAGSVAVTSGSCLARLLPLLYPVLLYSQAELCQFSSMRNSTSSTTTSSTSSNHSTGAVPSEASRFNKLGAALEAVLRVITAEVQSGKVSKDDLPVLNSKLFTELLLTRHADTDSVLMQHMGLCGPVALVQEQRELYSLLSTVLKIGRRQAAAAKPCWGERATGSCCLAAAQAAVRLLSPPPPPGSAAAAAQQPETDYLPTLVIFGRCCLQWAEQLQRQMPKLLLLASGALGAAECQDALLHETSAAMVCIPGLRQGTGLTPGFMLEGFVYAVSEWVDCLESPAALAQLQAAGCAPQQLQQQLQALSATQQGTQQGLTDASLTALVQQLHATGGMLNYIAVPHFCNNPACGNISGPTEVQLVSGRSCICAGCCTARYCGRDCQRAAWKQHKPVCKALAAAAAAATAS